MHTQPQIHAATLATAAALAKGAERRRSRAPAGQKRRERLVRAGAELAGLLGRATGWLAARTCRLPSPAASPYFPSEVAKLALVASGRRQALPKRLAARPRFQLPVVQSSSENAPHSL